MDDILAGFLQTLRRSGLGVSPAEAIDAHRAAMLVGIGDRAVLRAALGATLAKSRSDRERVLQLFDLYFTAGAPAALEGDLGARLRARGVSEDAIGRLRALLEAGSGGAPRRVGSGTGLGSLLGQPEELDRLLRLAGLRERVEGMQSPLQIGIFTHRMLAELGWPALEAEVQHLRQMLAELLGDESETIAAVLQEALDRTRARVRDEVQREFARLHAGALGELRQRLIEERDFAALSASEVESVRAIVRKLAARLRGTESLRRKRERRGRFDARRTIQRSLATSGVPMEPQFRRRRRDRPRLVILCDISDSVRQVARLMLEFVYSVQSIFSRTRSFVFVAEIGEATRLFAEHPVERAIGLVYTGAVVSAFAGSNYGRSLVQFRRRHLHEIDRRTTVVVLGDGRNNGQPPEAEVLDEIRRRAARLIWLTPEGRAAWGFGDSVMHLYAPRCTSVHTVRNLVGLRAAIDAIVQVARAGR